VAVAAGEPFDGVGRTLNTVVMFFCFSLGYFPLNTPLDE
jgi:hypothetical protein